MDVTFFEHQSYYPKSEIQREIMREYQLWDILALNLSTQFNLGSPRNHSKLLQPMIILLKTPFLSKLSKLRVILLQLQFNPLFIIIPNQHKFRIMSFVSMLGEKDPKRR